MVNTDIAGKGIQGNWMASICTITRASDLDRPGSDETRNPPQVLDSFENIRLMIYMTRMCPGVLDHIVLLVMADMPTRCSPTMNQEVVKDALHDIICEVRDLDPPEIRN